MNAQTITDLVFKAYHGDTHAQVRVTRALVDMCSFHENLLLDVKMLEGAISHGRLDVRADPAKYSGEYKKIIDSMNTTLDAVTGPLKMSIEYTDQLSRGIIPLKITGICYGDGNRIKNNLNNCIDAFNAFGKDTRSSVQDTISYQKTPGMINENSIFSVRIDDTAHMLGGFVAMRNPVTTASAVLPVILSTISLEVTEIATHNQQARKSTTKLASDTAQVGRSADVVHYHAGRGDEKVKEILHGMKGLSAGIREISTDTNAVLGLARKTSLLSGTAAEYAVKVKKELTGITHTSLDVDALISNLLVLVCRIGDNTGHILTLSDRIQVLVANASNDIGKPVNFHKNTPVHAGEIKFLADASHESADSITGLIIELQKESRLAKAALKTMNNGVKNGSTAFNEASALFTQVAGSVEQMSRNMEDVLVSSRSQGKSAMKLNAQVQDVDYIVRGTAEKASDVAKACKKTSSSLYQVAQDMADVNRYTMNVASDTAKYKEKNP